MTFPAMHHGDNVMVSFLRLEKRLSALTAAAAPPEERPGAGRGAVAAGECAVTDWVAKHGADAHDVLSELTIVAQAMHRRLSGRPNHAATTVELSEPPSGAAGSHLRCIGEKKASVHGGGVLDGEVTVSSRPIGGSRWVSISLLRRRLNALLDDQPPFCHVLQSNADIHARRHNMREAAATTAWGAMSDDGDNDRGKAFVTCCDALLRLSVAVEVAELSTAEKKKRKPLTAAGGTPHGDDRGQREERPPVSLAEGWDGGPTSASSEGGDEQLAATRQLAAPLCERLIHWLRSPMAEVRLLVLDVLASSSSSPPLSIDDRDAASPNVRLVLDELFANTTTRARLMSTLRGVNNAAMGRRGDDVRPSREDASRSGGGVVEATSEEEQQQRCHPTDEFLNIYVVNGEGGGGDASASSATSPSGGVAFPSSADDAAAASVAVLLKGIQTGRLSVASVPRWQHHDHDRKGVLLRNKLNALLRVIPWAVATRARPTSPGASGGRVKRPIFQHNRRCCRDDGTDDILRRVILHEMVAACRLSAEDVQTCQRQLLGGHSPYGGGAAIPPRVAELSSFVQRLVRQESANNGGGALRGLVDTAVRQPSVSRDAIDVMAVVRGDVTAPHHTTEEMLNLIVDVARRHRRRLLLPKTSANAEEAEESSSSSSLSRANVGKVKAKSAFSHRMTTTTVVRHEGAPQGPQAVVAKGRGRLPIHAPSEIASFLPRKSLRRAVFINHDWYRDVAKAATTCDAEVVDNEAIAACNSSDAGCTEEDDSCQRRLHPGATRGASFSSPPSGWCFDRALTFHRFVVTGGGAPRGRQAATSSTDGMEPSSGSLSRVVLDLVRDVSHVLLWQYHAALAAEERRRRQCQMKSPEPTSDMPRRVTLPSCYVDAIYQSYGTPPRDAGEGSPRNEGDAAPPSYAPASYAPPSYAPASDEGLSPSQMRDENYWPSSGVEGYGPSTPLDGPSRDNGYAPASYAPPSYAPPSYAPPSAPPSYAPTIDEGLSPSQMRDENYCPSSDVQGYGPSRVEGYDPTSHASSASPGRNQSSSSACETRRRASSSAALGSCVADAANCIDIPSTHTSTAMLERFWRVTGAVDFVSVIIGSRDATHRHAAEELSTAITLITRLLYEDPATLCALWCTGRLDDRVGAKDEDDIEGSSSESFVDPTASVDQTATPCSQRPPVLSEIATSCLRRLLDLIAALDRFSQHPRGRQRSERRRKNEDTTGRVVDDDDEGHSGTAAALSDALISFVDVVAWTLPFDPTMGWLDRPANAAGGAATSAGEEEFCRCPFGVPCRCGRPPYQPPSFMPVMRWSDGDGDTTALDTLRLSHRTPRARLARRVLLESFKREGLEVALWLALTRLCGRWAPSYAIDHLGGPWQQPSKSERDIDILSRALTRVFGAPLERTGALSPRRPSMVPTSLEGAELHFSSECFCGRGETASSSSGSAFSGRPPMRCSLSHFRHLAFASPDHENVCILAKPLSVPAMNTGGNVNVAAATPSSPSSMEPPHLATRVPIPRHLHAWVYLATYWRCDVKTGTASGRVARCLKDTLRSGATASVVTMDKAPQLNATTTSTMENGHMLCERDTCGWIRHLVFEHMWLETRSSAEQHNVV